jgi:hypothetical protein
MLKCEGFWKKKGLQTRKGTAGIGFFPLDLTEGYDAASELFLTSVSTKIGT